MTKKYWLGAGIAVAAGIGLYAFQAKAADLSGGCCADLEERLAELEAVATHKGNRKVKLTVSGYVSHSIMHWDDGTTSDTYIGDGGAISSRFRFQGEAKVNPDLTAGFTYEFGINNNAIGSMNQGPGGDDAGGAVSLRDSTVWLQHKMLGKLKVGHGSTATDNLILVDLSNSGVIASADPALFNGGFLLNSGAAGGLVPFSWANLLNQGVSFDTTRRNHVSWESPILAGFSVTGAVAEDNFWDVALRYAGEFGGLRVAGGVGYAVDSETPGFHPFGSGGPMLLTAAETKTTMASLSILHTTSGLFVTGAGGQRETDWGVTSPNFSLSTKDATFWHVIAGIQRNWFGFGATTFYGEYHEATDMVGFDASWTWGSGGSAQVSSKANVVGFGVVQRIDAADMDLYVGYKNYSGDVDASYVTGGGSSGAGVADIQDFQAVIGGVRLKF